ncbi:Zinc/iron permease [Lactarius akahatsu]|uniref:Zinc/iron permease n=1 Tax=Lactarius akahatsu TaxID=416441 RepID=A0AAD4Q5Y9_9AGAM|nr:Zinc/iron permease [Lactarius akahatsu]
MLTTATRNDDDPHSKGTDLSARVAVMAVIFCVSLFAVSFPTLSKRIRYIRIPPIVFFVGKHFGTGVILSTAFVHLLQDAFDRLQDPDVKRYTSIGHWAGLIVLSSLLVIFLVEYISTAYVDHLHSYSSVPSTPKVEPAQLPPISSPPITPSQQAPREGTPLLGACSSACTKQPRQNAVAGAHSHDHSHGLLPGHHRHEPHRQHDQHHTDHPRCVLTHFYESTDGEGCASAKVSSHVGDHQVGEAQHYQVHSHSHGHGHHGHGDLEGLLEGADSEADTDCTAEEEEADRIIGRKRQIVGILVLQLGIMLHSLVIGFTLALASGSDFESLATAISFHQLFEGLSLGIRIAALPAHPDPQQRSTLSWLRPLLALLFALTTPAGILSGLIVFDAGHRGGGVGAKVAEGVLSAVSAGMLIYAACVEMLAADFVLDPTLWRSSKGRQVLALASVGMGAAGMVLLEYVFLSFDVF